MFLLLINSRIYEKNTYPKANCSLTFLNINLDLESFSPRLPCTYFTKHYSKTRKKEKGSFSKGSKEEEKVKLDL